jgi:hypothetical protein
VTELAVGNFNGYTWGGGIPVDQLAIGAPHRGPLTSQGWVYTFSQSWLSGNYMGLELWKDFGQYGAGLNNNAYDHFGSVLATGNFNGDAYDDLLVGVPDETNSGADDSGAVLLFSGSSFGVTGAGVHYWQTTDNAAGDEFGASLAVGDFSGNGKPDFCAAAPGEAYGADPHAGAVYLYTGRQSTWPEFYSYHDQESGAFQ